TGRSPPGGSAIRIPNSAISSTVLSDQLCNVVWCDVFDEVVIDEHGCCEAARAEALHFDDGPLAVGTRGARVFGAGLLQERFHDSFGAADVARRRRADLDEVLSHGMLVVHR